MGRGRLLRRRPPARRGRPDALAARVARDLRRPAGRALVPAERGLRAPARGTGRGRGEGRCSGGLTAGPSTRTASRTWGGDGPRLGRPPAGRDPGRGTACCGSHTVTALRAGGVLTLGELRAMGDRELLRLRRFGPAALVDVRLLVPAPAGSRAASAGGEVTIAGRAFRLGAVYAPRPGARGHKPCRLLGYTADSLLPGGRVQVAVLPKGRRRSWPGRSGRPGRASRSGMARGTSSDERRRFRRPGPRPGRAERAEERLAKARTRWPRPRSRPRTTRTPPPRSSGAGSSTRPPRPPWYSPAPGAGSSRRSSSRPRWRGPTAC